MAKKTIGINNNKRFGLDNLIQGPQKEKEEPVINIIDSNDEVEEEELQDEQESPMLTTLDDTEEITYLNPERRKPGRPKLNKTPKSTSQIGTYVGETRYTIIANEELLEKIKRIAYWERLKIKDVFNMTFESFIKDYESKYGEIKKIPE